MHSQDESGQCGAAPTERWFALYVKSRHEKAIAGALGELGYERFVPLLHPAEQKKLCRTATLSELCLLQTGFNRY
jgi:hypothetical protein